MQRETKYLLYLFISASKKNKWVSHNSKAVNNCVASFFKFDPTKKLVSLKFYMLGF